LAFFWLNPTGASSGEGGREAIEHYPAAPRIDSGRAVLYSLKVVSRGIFLAAWLGLAVSASAAERPAVFLAAAARGGEVAVRPGEVVEVRWAAVPRGVEEMELLLSLDGGRHFTVRVTPDLEADRGSYAWRVPPLPSGDARLAVRVNLDGREVLGGVSARFRIADDHAVHRWSARSHGGDLWVSSPEGGAMAPPPGRDDDRDAVLQLAGRAPRSRLAPGWPGAASLTPPSLKQAPSRRVAVAARDHTPASSQGATTRARRDSCPLALPLRI
jgi:hypothetical protein